MTTVTVDTSIFPSDDLRAALEPKGFSFAAVTVTERELTGHDLAVELQQLSSVPEVAVRGESTWRTGLWGGPYKTRIMTRDEFVTAFILKPA